MASPETGIDGSEADKTSYPDAISKLGHYTGEEIAAAEKREAEKRERAAETQPLADFLADAPRDSEQQDFDPEVVELEKKAAETEARRKLLDVTDPDRPSFDKAYHDRRMAGDPEYRQQVNNSLRYIREQEAGGSGDAAEQPKKTRLQRALSALGTLITGKD